MSRLFYHICQDNLGNLLFDVSGTMRIAGTGTLATIYGDEALSVIIPNPMTNHPSFGSFKCFLGAGDYDFYMAKSGYTFETLTGVQGLGTMAQQDASAVAITGGSIRVPSGSINGGVQVTDAGTSDRTGLRLQVQAGTNKWNLYGDGTAPSYLAGALGVRGVPGPEADLQIVHRRDLLHHALVIASSGNDASGYAVQFLNTSAVVVGSILCTGTTTAYNTTSDARLKKDVAPLTGALDVVRALKPVSFLWNADGSPGRGLLASEVQEVITEGVITGERDAVDADGNVVPQMIDYSKLVPYLIGAVKELTQQVETLTARLEAAGA